MLKSWLRKKISSRFPDIDFDVLIPPDDKMGDYSTNVAFVLARANRGNAEETEDTEIKKLRNKEIKKSGNLKSRQNAEEIGRKLAAELGKDKELSDVFEKIEAAKPGFVNFYLSDNFLRRKFSDIVGEKNYGFNDSMKGKTVMVEYTDPNPFKLFHIGHLMSNAIGEAISRLYEASGAKVLRANYQGDVGLHVAKAVWGMLNMEYGIWNMEKIGQAYAKGAKAYEENEDAKKEIEEINNKIYDRSDGEINKLYDLGKKWSLEYFETIYKKLGTKFDRYFFESEAASDGLSIIEKHPDVFVESDLAKVFRGEEYGLHTRVFVSSKGLPTYEAKELGVNKKKFEKDNPDLSIIVTGNEINEYFKVLLKVMELTMPDVAAKTKHISHGMLRLPAQAGLPGGRGVGSRGAGDPRSGAPLGNSVKMSSRTGDVITAESLIEQIKSKLPESESEEVDSPLLESYGEAREKIAIGAIKYSILKQSPGHDIIFDFDKSLSVKGDSGPYLQYTYARLNSIISKAGKRSIEDGAIKSEYLTDPTELRLIKKLLTFPDVVIESSEKIFPQHIALYLYELANDANRFYESVRVLDDEDSERRNTRLTLVETVAAVLERGLNILGIETLKRI